MQLVSHSHSHSSSSSSSSHSSGERHSCEQKGMEKFERMHLHSPPPPPPPPPLPPHFKGKKHRHHSPPPPHHHHHHHQHFVNKHRHHSPSPLRSLHCEKGKLRVKPPKPSKKVRKLHHKLMKACKLPKGAHHHYQVPPAPEPGFYSADAAYEHRQGCCLHYHGMSMADHERPAEERRPPHEVGGGHGFGHLRPPHEGGVGHHGHLRPHPRKRHPCVNLEIRRGAVPPMLPSHEATATPAEPPIEADAPPPAATMLLADEAAHATLAAY